MLSGVIKGKEISVNKNGTHAVLLLKVEVTDPNDIQTVELMSQAGVDCSPVIGSKVTMVQVGEAWKIAVATNDGIIPEVSEGEYEIYSSANGVKQVKIRCKNDGKINISNASESFNTLFDDLIDTIINIVTTGPHVLSNVSKAQFEIIKNRFRDILG